MAGAVLILLVLFLIGPLALFVLGAAWSAGFGCLLTEETHSSADHAQSQVTNEAPTEPEAPVSHVPATQEKGQVASVASAGTKRQVNPTALRDLPWRLLLSVLTVTAALFLIAGAATGDFGRAWDVLAGSRSPWGAWSWLTAPLSVLGYLFLPVLIALGVTDGVARYTRRRLRDSPAIEEDLFRFLDEKYAKWEAKENPP